MPGWLFIKDFASLDLRYFEALIISIASDSKRRIVRKLSLKFMLWGRSLNFVNQGCNLIVISRAYGRYTHGTTSHGKKSSFQHFSIMCHLKIRIPVYWIITGMY